MTSNTILELIDAEIATLEHVRSILGGITTSPTVTKPSTSTSPKVKNKLSADGRAKIAAAQKLRWALLRKAAK